MQATEAQHETAQPREAALTVEGMTCASCVAHVSKAARSVPGVQSADVHLARGRAVVRFDPAKTDPTQVAAAINQSGYHAHVVDVSVSAANAEEQRLAHQHAHARSWFRRFIVGFALWIPVELTHWILYLADPHFHHRHGWMNWVALVTSTIAITYVGSGFYAGAWNALKHRTTNM